MKKIGFSLSFCVKDIVEGKVKIEDVHHIVTGCSPESDGDVEHYILQPYEKVYWRHYPKIARAVFNQLRNDRKIMWCSHWEKTPVNIGTFHWLDCPEMEPQPLKAL